LLYTYCSCELSEVLRQQQIRYCKHHELVMNVGGKKKRVDVKFKSLRFTIQGDLGLHDKGEGMNVE